MELRHLRYFMAVAEAGSFSRASQKLFIAQPPLSLQIRQLEDALGSALFTRHPKGVRLTAAGEALLPEARQLLGHAARLGELVQGPAGAGGGGGALTLGYVPSASSTVLPELVRQLRRLRPGLVLGLREMISDEQQQALVAGHIDLGLARSAPRHVRIATACRIDDPFCLALPADAALAAPGPGPGPGLASGPALVPLTLRDYAEQDFVAFTRHSGPAYFDQTIHLCRQAGFSPRIRYEASTVHGVLDLVGAGLGLALVPASSVLLAVKGVRVRALQRSGPPEGLALLRRKADANPALPVVAPMVQAILTALARRMASALAKA